MLWTEERPPKWRCSPDVSGRDDCITVALGSPEVRVVRQEEAEEIVVEVAYRRENAACPRYGLKTP